MNKITIIQPDDWHLHLRDGQLLKSVVLDTAKQFARAIIMPNLKPPVININMAVAYKRRILQAIHDLDPDNAFEPLMTLYLTDNTSPEEIKKAKESGLVYGLKLYPAGATTNSDAGVTDLLKHCAKTLEAMQRYDMPLLVHGEVTDPDVDVFDREAVFIERIMQPLRLAYPALKIVFEHITTAEGVAYVEQSSAPTGATITPQHLLYNRNSLFKGGLRPHWYCLPILKREKHRLALLKAATSGSDKFFLGTDSAPHLRGAKEQDCGCAGCYTAKHAMALYATAFDAMGKLENLESFASLNGPKFYGLEPNKNTISLERKISQIPSAIALGSDELIPLAAGEKINWELV